jgi:hypothetical protein
MTWADRAGKANGDSWRWQYCVSAQQRIFVNQKSLTSTEGKDKDLPMIWKAPYRWHTYYRAKRLFGVRMLGDRDVEQEKCSVCATKNSSCSTPFGGKPGQSPSSL